MFWEISQNSQENTCARLSFLIKLQACNLIKKETVAQVFSFEFWEISKNTFFQGTPLVAAFALYLPINLDLDIRGGSSYSLREVIAIQRIINLGSLNSLVNSKWGSFCTSKWWQGHPYIRKQYLQWHQLTPNLWHFKMKIIA